MERGPGCYARWAMKLVLSVAALIVIVASVGLAWWPLAIVEAELTASLGGYETVGAGSWGLRLACTTSFTVLVVAAAVRPVRWAMARLAGSGLADVLPVVLIHWALYIPVWGWTAAGLVNALFGPSEGLAIDVRFDGIEKRSKGPNHWTFSRADGESWSLSEIQPPGLDAGEHITLFERRGPLGMTYVSLR